jgi:Flp pilus assembly protein TadG
MLATMSLRRPREMGGDLGQSLVEISLALPLLMLIVLGIADFARFAYYSSAVANAAREAALYAARNSGATTAVVRQHACDELGLTPYGSACPTAVTVTCQRGTKTCDAGKTGDITVGVTYDFRLVSGELVQLAFPVNPIRINAKSMFPDLTQ